MRYPSIPSLSIDPGRRRLLLGALLACCAEITFARAENQAMENQVKAAFLYKFGSYVEWPAQTFERPDSPFVIGILATDNFADMLEQLIAGRGMNGRPVVVQRMRRGEPPKGQHILFIAHTESTALSEMVAATKGKAVLTVTDSERGLGTGCMISFVVENNRVRFDIAPEPAEQNKLKISARLMSVARKVAGRTASS
jgi:hypothetical protein